MASPSVFSSEGASTVGQNTQEGHSTLEVASQYAEHQQHSLPEFQPEAPQYQGHTPIDYGVKYVPPPAPDGEEPTTETGRSGRICGLKKKLFFALVAFATLLIIGLAVGLGVGLTQGSGGDSSKGDRPGSDDSNDDLSSNALRGTSRIVASSFDDEYGNENYIVLYQRENRAIYMSTYNSSKEEWIISPVVNGTNGPSLDTIRGDTSLGLNVYYSNATTRYTHIFWQQTNNAIRNRFRSTIRTDIESGPEDWESPFDEDDLYTASNGSAIVSHGRPCEDCMTTGYLFFQDDDGAVMSGHLKGTNEQGWTSEDYPEAPIGSSGTAMAVASLPADDGSKGWRLYYRSGDGKLTELGTRSNTRYDTIDIDRGLGSEDALAAFSTGTNDDNNDLGIHVLSVGKGADDGVLLTYYHEGEWNNAKTVYDLGECTSRASITATFNARIYCVVDGDDGVEIKEWKWRGDPDDTTTFTSYKEVGRVKT